MEHLWCHEKKRSKRVLLWCDVDILYENTLVLKNKQVSKFLSENLILMKSCSREVFGKNCDLIHLLSLTQIDLINAPTIKGMLFHHRPISIILVVLCHQSYSSIDMHSSILYNITNRGPGVTCSRRRCYWQHHMWIEPHFQDRRGNMKNYGYKETK